ncbi:MAG: GIY-YIG nuclease family protein [Patescibacteria group bacterium]|nr:GIY-YIG nuclease family protein [Patescibacteria group bacterium]
MLNQYNQLVNPAPIVIWVGASLRRYEFQLHPIPIVYLERPGVYIFCSRAINGNWNAIYVGETDNFSRRLTNELATHHRWKSIRAAGATHICTLHVPGHDSLRLQIETDLRHSLNPPCNRQ